ncbi:MAG: tyrosine--tRNA ligase [Thermodesulfobacteriota bacterium]
MNILDIFNERGFIESTTHDQELRELLSGGPATCYIGFDPTADSLHVGSLVPIMSLAHFQKAGHRPVALVGGGTGLVGDPSGKTEMRQLLSPDIVARNVGCLQRQLSNFIDFSEDRALLVNNAEWLTGIEYIPFLRDIGRHFSVNRMLKAESYRMRLESEEGLNFIEFNYMLLQAYDFLNLYDKLGCCIQMGGADQWGNIVAGIELVRKMRQQTVCGITFPLITTSSGAKMGKTAQGAVWLDPAKTSPYEYFQFWINTDDLDVKRFLALFTFIPMNEINEIQITGGSELNNAKSVLAYEATKLAHGADEALKAYRAAVSMFGAREIPDLLLPSSSIPRGGVQAQDDSAPQSELSLSLLAAGIPAFKLFQQVGLAASGGAARRLIEQGGAYINDQRIQASDYVVTGEDLNRNEMILRAGKKKYHIVKIV